MSNLAPQWKESFRSVTDNAELFRKIDTFILRVSDLRRAREWYERVLGLRAVYVDERERIAVLDVGDADGVSLTLSELKPEERGNGRGLQNFPILHPAAHIELTHAAMRDRGVRVEPIVGTQGRTRYFFFSDPDGNRLEVAQY